MIYDRASGAIKSKINNLEKGSAVQKPLLKLRELQALPPIASGQVAAGNVEDFPVLNRLPRLSAPYPALASSMFFDISTMSDKHCDPFWNSILPTFLNLNNIFGGQLGQ